MSDGLCDLYYLTVVHRVLHDFRLRAACTVQECVVRQANVYVKT